MTIPEFNKLKTSDITSRYIRWKKLMEDGASIDEMKKAVFHLITGCYFQTIKCNSGSFFRARKNNGNALFNNVSDLWYPPKEFIKEMGRANRVGQSMMYIGQDGRTTLFEMRLKNDDCVTVGVFLLKEFQSLNLQYLVSLENLNNPALKPIISARHSGMKTAGYSTQGMKNVNLIHKILSEEFRRTDIEAYKNPYTLSAAVAETLLSYENADGLMYPSIQYQNDFNIVLHPKSAERTLALSKCDYLKVCEEGTRDIIFHHQFTTSSIDQKTGIMNWTNSFSPNLNWNTSGTPSLTRIDR